MSEEPTHEPAVIRDETRRILQTLVAFDTTSSNSNLELIGWVSDYLAGFGVTAELVTGPSPDKANLYATLGPEDRGGVALSGHSDVVPVAGQDWRTDPCGRLYGRGTCDMKGFIATALAFVPDFLSRPLRRPAHLCFSFDEEIGCHGVPHLLAELARRPVRPVMCIVGEPTGMKVMTAHKGKVDVVCRVRGVPAHSSLAPRGVNAINAAARVIAYLERLARQKAEQGPFEEDYDITHTTVHTGLVEGGTQLNIVPGHCSFEFEVRNLPTDDPDVLLAEVRRFAHEEVEPPMQAIDPETGFSWEEIARYPGLDTAPDEDVVTLAQSLAGSNATGKVAFGTEAGLFQASGIPCVVCGPGSIEQAHKPDEFVTLDQLRQCERFMGRLLDHLAATPPRSGD
jgi:acetylornithine deacetylase